MNLETTGKSAVKNTKSTKIIEEKDKDSYIMFDIELKNTKPNKENQRLL